MDQLVLDIEEAEIISGSEIDSIEFGTEESTTQDSKEDVGNENRQKAEGERQAGETVKKPNGVETNSKTVKVAASNYFELKSFIETLEGLQRIITVDSIDFNGPEEITSWNQDAGNINFTLTLSVFFMSSLNDLKEGLPSLEIPEPSNKKNPFYTFGSVLQNGQE
ncbi:hypothetical protein [Mesobacillus zeae]|uniref:Uncharacterized protein n=1 Tax=Mesobacillus zeae TaxID=1917180 RepID=A0A398B1Q9_9BACI|nr:hypothetical protein [Mesobacillus zeae]RID83264.1 hypothetical protein D1970_17290 [Mesobacillus zeae]